MDTNVFQLCDCADTPPRLLHVDKWLAFDIADDDIRVVGYSGNALQFIGCCLTEINGLLARLGIRQVDHSVGEVNIVPFELLNLAKAAARIDQ